MLTFPLSQNPTTRRIGRSSLPTNRQLESHNEPIDSCGFISRELISHVFASVSFESLHLTFKKAMVCAMAGRLRAAEEERAATNRNFTWISSGCRFRFPQPYPPSIVGITGATPYVFFNNSCRVASTSAEKQGVAWKRMFSPVFFQPNHTTNRDTHLLAALLSWARHVSTWETYSSIQSQFHHTSPNPQTTNQNPPLLPPPTTLHVARAALSKAARH